MHAFIPSVPTPAPAGIASTSTKVINPLPSSNSSPVVAAAASRAALPCSSPRVAPFAPLDALVGLPSAKPDGRGARPSRILMLFHGDLRVYDNAALSTAVTDSGRLPSGVFIPALLSSSRAPAAYVADLSRQVASLGSRLLDVPDVGLLSNLIRKADLDGVYMNYAADGDGARAQKRVVKFLQQQHKNVEICMFWSNCLLSPPSNAHLQPTQTQNGKQPRSVNGGNKSRASFSALWSDIRSQPIAATTQCAKTPQSLPALPVAVSTTFKSPAASASSATGSALNDAMAALQKLDKRRETVAFDKSPDIAVVVKPLLDHGVLSMQMVAKHVHRAMDALKGRTFSELVWRTYVCLSANASAGVRSVQRNPTFA